MDGLNPTEVGEPKSANPEQTTKGRAHDVDTRTELR